MKAIGNSGRMKRKSENSQGQNSEGNDRAQGESTGAPIACQEA